MYNNEKNANDVKYFLPGKSTCLKMNIFGYVSTNFSCTIMKRMRMMLNISFLEKVLI